MSHASIDLTTALASPTRFSLPQDLSIDDWCRIGTQISRFSDASAWWIGDWIIYGQQKYKDQYKRAIKNTFLDYQTLRNYAWIARRFSPSRRRANLTFQHHVEVAALPPDEQDHWLDFAERFKWARNELRKQIKAGYDTNDCVERAKQIQLKLQVSPDRVERWEQAASKSSRSLIDWIAKALDEVAQLQSSI